MKAVLIVALFLGASLVLAPVSAQAYAIYNHVDHKVCVQTPTAQFFLVCNFKIDANGHHNGAHGSGLGKHGVQWKGEGKCWMSQWFTIPKGGYANIDKHEVKIYKHNNEHIDTKAVHWADPRDCPGPINKDWP